MGNIGEGTRVDESRCAFQSLHQVGFDGVFHQYGQRAGYAQVFSGDGFALLIGADHDLAKALAHIGQVSGQGQDGHDFACYGDIEAGLAFEAFLIRAFANGDGAQEAVVGIDHASPGDAIGVDIQAGEAAALFSGQVVRVGFVNSQFL